MKKMKLATDRPINIICTKCRTTFSYMAKTIKKIECCQECKAPKINLEVYTPIAHPEFPAPKFVG